MKNRSTANTSGVLILLLIVICLSSACTPPGYTPQIHGVSLDREYLLIEKDHEVQLVASITPGAKYKSITWRSTSVGTATVTQTGLVKGVSETVNDGHTTVTITVIAENGELFQAFCDVHVIDFTPVASVTITPKPSTMTVGRTETLTANVFPNYASERVLHWEVDPPSTAVSISPMASVHGGSVTLTARSAGTATIFARAIDGSNKFDSFPVTVSGGSVSISVTGVTLSPTTHIFTSAGATQQLTPTIAPSTATNKTVTWSSDNPSVATVSTSGLVTAVANGPATITVTTSDGGHTHTCGITVSIPPPTVPVTGVTIDQASPQNIQPGGTATLSATIVPSGATNQNVTWSVTGANPSSITVSPTTAQDASASVTVTVPAGAIPGDTATITVTSVDNSSATALITVNVIPIPVTSVTIDQSDLTLALSDNVTLTATIAPPTATNKSVTWSSDNPTIVDVDSDGNLTLHTTGNAEITVTADDATNSATDSITVTVN